MKKSHSADIERTIAKRELLRTREALIHLVQLYNSGRWRRYYKERTFINMVRRTRQAVDRLTDVCK